MVIITSPPVRAAKYCDDRVCLCVCVCVCLFVHEHMSVTTRPQKVLCMFPMAMVRSSSASIAMRYILPVLCMTLYLCLMGTSTAVVLLGTASQPVGAASLGQWLRRLTGLGGYA